MNYAVSQKFDLVDLLAGADPRILKAQIEQSIRAAGRRGPLRRGQRRDAPGHPIPGPGRGQIQEPMIEVAQRIQYLGRQVRFLRPVADECFLHDRLPPKSGFKWGFKGHLRISPQTQRLLHAETPWQSR